MAKNKLSAVISSESTAAMFDGAGMIYPVQTDASTIYHIYGSQATTYPAYHKSIDGGLTWNRLVQISTTSTVRNLAVWYDKWSGLAGTLIHIAWIESATDDVRYINLDTSTDTLSSEYVIWAGATTGINSCLGITRARGGNLICCGMIDGGTEIFARKSTDVGVNWSDITAVMESAATDQIILQPNPDSADNQDILCYFWDASANEISVKRFDDSGNSWAETSIAGSMTDTAATTTYPHWAATPDITNSQNLLVAWSAVDAANADLRCWNVKDGSITETAANVVLNSTDDQGLCAIAIDTATDYWYVFYGGASDGSETWNSAVNVYYKVSTDGGATWGAENKITSRTFALYFMYCCPRFVQPFVLEIGEALVSNYIIYFIIDISLPKATFQLGM